MVEAARNETPYLTMDEYQAFNEQAEWRHEYARGRMWPQGYPDSVTNSMAGANRDHTRIKSNVDRALNSELEDRPFEAFSSDQQVWHEEAEFAASPDIVAFCEEAEFRKHRGLDSLLNPRVIIEILSPSTEKFDRQEKFAYYRLFPSLRDYLLIDPIQLLVEHYQRGEGEVWGFQAHTTAESVVELRSIGCRLALSEVYSRIQFPPTENRWPRLVR